jgi:hypothetical protein
LQDINWKTGGIIARVEEITVAIIGVKIPSE